MLVLQQVRYWYESSRFPILLFGNRLQDGAVSSAPAPQFDPAQSIDRAGDRAGTEPAVAAEPEQNAELPLEPKRPIEYIGVSHLTRTWVQYGIFGFAVLCNVIGAVEALFGR